MVRYERGHRERMRETIVSSASRILRDKGFTEASVPQVMKAVGLTHGGFYAHFSDKNALLTAAVDEAFVQSPKNFAALADMANMSADAGLIAKHYLSDSRVADVASGCPAAALMGEVRRQDADVLAAFQAGSEQTMQALATAKGLSEPDGDHAWAALAMLVGGLAMMRAMPAGETRAAIRGQIISAMRKLTSDASSNAATQHTPKKAPT